jgi:hypothetical protein
MWTLPYKETTNQEPKAIVGSMDPAMRKYITSGILLFSLPSERFVELADNASKSFLQEKSWLTLLN